LELTKIRQESLDELHAALKVDGTPAQRTWLDRYASTREQIDSIDGNLLETFDSINDNSQNSQIAAAIALIQMQVSPVLQISIAFGGDNHRDGGLTQEAEQSVTGIAAIGSLLTQIDEAGLRNDVTVANLSVFGRTLQERAPGGRNHNLNHHAMMISGSNVNPGVIGGIERSGNDWGATGINSVNGASNNNGDIPQNETLEAATKTLGCALGISEDRMNTRISGGKVIQAALNV